LNQAFFERELRALRYLGNARSSEEFRAELASYRSDYRRHGGFLRKVLAVWLSGQKLMELAALTCAGVETDGNGGEEIGRAVEPGKEVSPITGRLTKS
jgi:hypothetical protein